MLRGTEKILVVKMSALGDVVQSLAFLDAVKARYPSARVSWLVDRSNLDLLRDHPLLDETLVFERRLWGRFRGGRSAIEIVGLAKNLRKKRFDVVVDLQGLLRSALITLTSGAPLRVGFDRSRERTPWCYTARVDAGDPREVHAIDRYLAMARWLGCPADGPRFPLAWTDRDREEGDHLLRECGLMPGEPYILLCPTARWESKRWPAGSFGLLSDELERRTSLTRLLIGAPGEEAVGLAVLRSAALPVHSLIGKTPLRALAVLLAGARLLVTNDSGPMHIAAAVGTPVVALFGPTHPKRCGPYGTEHRVLQASCRCASLRRSPRFCQDVPSCLGALSVGVVAEASLQALQGGGSGRAAPPASFWKEAKAVARPAREET